jgi:hypothetical protein
MPGGRYSTAAFGRTPAAISLVSNVYFANASAYALGIRKNSIISSVSGHSEISLAYTGNLLFRKIEAVQFGLDIHGGGVMRHPVRFVRVFSADGKVLGPGQITAIYSDFSSRL